MQISSLDIFRSVHMCVCTAVCEYLRVSVYVSVHIVDLQRIPKLDIFFDFSSLLP